MFRFSLLLHQHPPQLLLFPQPLLLYILRFVQFLKLCPPQLVHHSKLLGASTVAPHISSVLPLAITIVAQTVTSPQVAKPPYTLYYNPLVDFMVQRPQIPNYSEDTGTRATHIPGLTLGRTIVYSMCYYYYSYSNLSAECECIFYLSALKAV